MITQSIVWTLLPNGLQSQKRARASVLVSPRLRLTPDLTPPQLSHFPMFRDWPAALSGARFKVLVNGSTTIEAALASVPDSAVWQAVFPLTTFVRPWEFDASGLRDKVIESFPAEQVAAMVEALYGEIAILSASGVPKRNYLASKILGDRRVDPTNGRPVASDLRPDPMTPAEVLDRLRQEKRRYQAAPGDRDPKSQRGSGLMADRKHAIDLLQAYHTPLQALRTERYKPDEAPEGYTEKFPNEPNPMRHAEWPTRERAPLTKAADFQKLIDFHQIASALCQYSDLMRSCGLVVDLEFDRPPQAAILSLQLLQPLPPGGDGDVLPKVNVNNTGGVFCAAKKTAASPIVDRYLRLADPDYSIIQMDVDGAGMKIKNLSESLSRQLPEEFDDTAFNDRDGHREQERAEPEAGLPALRTGGLTLAERRRDLSLAGLHQNGASMQSALETANAAPTLFAEDVIRGYRVDVLDREVGKWRSLFFRRTDFQFKNTGGGRATLKEEGMARLAAAASADDHNPDIIKVHEALATWTGWSLAAPEPGRLIRADEQGLPPVKEEQEASPPGLPLETAYSAVPGTLPRLRFGRTYAMRMRLVDLAGASEAFSEDNAQPKEAQSAWTTFRRYEPVEPPALALVKDGAAVDPVQDGESMQRLAIRTWNDTKAKNTIATDKIARRHCVPARVGHRFAEMHGVMDTGADKSLDPSIYALLIAKDKSLAEVEIDRGKVAGTSKPERYACADKNFELPYLPDPLAVGVAIRVAGAEGVNPATIHRFRLYPNGANWPHAAPFKIVVGEFAMPDAKFDDATREFRIPMKKAERARVFISSVIPKAAIGMMAVRDMIAKRNPTPALVAAIEQRILEGQHWMFTPHRTVEIVHAVQKPLITPDLENLAVNRTLGDLAAEVSFEDLPLNAKSTASIDVDGEWREPVDDPGDLQAAEGPYVREERAHAFTKKIARDSTPNDRFAFMTGKHVFSNANYRRVVYAMQATTRYKEFFEASIRNDDSQLKVISSKRVAWVPNAAPPPPPKVLYVVPTFGWARSADNAGATSLRAGGGLRVYLDRPWMTTGFTEMLGVVLPHVTANHPVSNAQADTRYAGSITMWGADPLWMASANLATASPPLSAFPLARTAAPISYDGSGLPAEEGIDLPEGPFQHTALPHPQISDEGVPYAQSVLLDVAPHVVGFDAERKLWYSDIVIRPPSGLYFPFVRLALARYNPVSVRRAHLSTMTITEFQQLAPDRLVILVKSSRSAKVSVHGTSPGTTLRDPFEAIIQVLDPGGDPDLDWRTVDEPAAERGFATPRRPRIEEIRPLDRPTARAPSASRILKLEADRLLQSGDIRALTARPDLIFALKPPLIWEKTVRLPVAPTGGRRRLLVIEREHHLRQRDDLGVPPRPPPAIGKAPLPVGSRIVFMETLDV